MSDLILHETPLGPLALSFDNDCVSGIQFDLDAARPSAGKISRASVDRLRRQLDAYFAGRGFDFDLPLKEIGTSFRLRVWAALRAVPYGQTISYGALAAKVGAPQAMRAVGSAMGANPLAIVTPCHRVIAAGGKIGGYGGGLDRKRWLLALEGAGADPALFAPAAAVAH